MIDSDVALLSALRETAHPLSDADPQDALIEAVGDARLPATERASHYFNAILPWQFDLVVHLDVTQAVEPLERMPLWEAGEPAETYPTGL